MPDIVIIADDLTGAMDSSVSFAKRGCRTVVAVGSAALPAALASGAQVVAVSTNSREVPVREAIERVGLVRDVIKDFRGIIFKKIDSRLKGHISEELQALNIEHRQAIACPAIPTLGRVVLSGALTGTGVSHPVSIAPRIGLPAIIPDIQSDGDIDAALPDDLRGVLLIGASGLAEAVARQLVPLASFRPIIPSEPVLLAIGSRDPITLVQVDAIGGIPVVAAPDGIVPVVEGSTSFVVQMTDGGSNQTADHAGRQLADGIAQLVARICPRTLFACGGETAAEIIQRLGIDLLEVEGECLPGVPSARALTGRPGLVIVTKSGGFGPRDTLARLFAGADAVADRHQTRGRP